MLKINYDHRGRLISINDLIRDVPFNIRRFMMIDRVPNGETRGFHAHKTNEQILLCFNGRIGVRTVIKNEAGELVEQNQELKDGDFIYMPAMTWAEQTYYDNAIANVLCSKKYDEEDYIRDYEEFKEL